MSQHTCFPMFLLTESTLFFINRAVSRETEKSSLDSFIDGWVNDVPPQADPKSNTTSLKLNTYSASQAASTPPSSVLSTTSTNISSKTKSAAIDKKQPTKLNIFSESTDDVLMVSDDSLDGSDVLERHPVALQKKWRRAVKVSHCFHEPFCSRTNLDSRSLL